MYTYTHKTLHDLPVCHQCWTQWGAAALCCQWRSSGTEITWHRSDFRHKITVHPIKYAHILLCFVFYIIFLHDRPWISPWIKSISNEIDITIHNSGNKHQNNRVVSTETVRHSSTYIILYVLNGFMLSIPILQDYFTGTGAILWLPQCQWSNPERYGWNQPILNHNSAQQIANQMQNYWVVLNIKHILLLMQHNCHIKQSISDTTDLSVLGEWVLTAMKFNG